MHIEYLRYILDVAKNQSISKTASLLYMSQQGLSRIIKIIEEEHGIIILERTGNTLSVTSAGKEFLKHAQKIVDEYDKLRLISAMYSKDKVNPQTKPISLFLSYCVANNLYPIISTSIATAFPSLSLSIIEANYEEILHSINESPSHNAIYLVTISEKTMIEPNMSFQFLMDTTTMVKVGKNSCYANKKYFHKDELKQAPLVILKDPVLLNIFDLFLDWKGKIPNNILLVTTNINYANRILKKRNAVGFIDSFFYHYYKPENFIVIPIKNSIRTPSGFLQNKNVALSPEAEMVKSYLTSYIKENFPLVTVQNFSTYTNAINQ
jgi:DNA-binding transcriptional LysR family regulator